MLDPHTFHARLMSIADQWIADGARRREVADTLADKVQSALEYGMADTLEDAASYIHKLIDQTKLDPSLPITPEKMAEQWAILATQLLEQANSDDNRLTAAYRRGGSLAYAQAAEQLREASKAADSTST